MVYVVVVVVGVGRGDGSGEGGEGGEGAQVPDARAGDPCLVVGGDQHGTLK